MIIYFLIVVIGSALAGKLILGELRKDRRDYVLIQPASKSVQDIKPVVAAPQKTAISPDAYMPFVKVERQAKRLQDWERILIQKNSEIEQLKKDLASQKNQSEEFLKIKALLERQIFESRQMYRAVKRELDALMAQGQRSQDEIAKLQMDLTYKNQLINQNEVKMAELKNRIANILPNTSAPAQPDPGPAPKEEIDLGNFSFDQLDWRKKLTE